MKTFYLKNKDIVKKNIELDATDEPVGRLAAKVCNILRGKNKVTFSPSCDCGDNVKIVNASKSVLTGTKSVSKVYYRHTGYMGGLKTRYSKDMNKSEIVMLAIKRMMPGGKLSRAQMKNLKIFE